MTEGATPQRVLLVDDEEDLVSSLVRHLRRELPGVTIDFRTQPEDALAEIGKSAVDLLVTDIRMPRMNGMELLIAARQVQPALPFVIMTAYPTEFTRIEALRLGSVSYIEKPFEVAALVTLVRDSLERQKQSGFSGDVMLETLPDLVQLFALSNLTGALHLWHGEDRGSIWFDRGSITHAVTSRLESTDAFYEVLTWTGGGFAMERGVVAPQVTIFENATGLLIEGLRRFDESRRAAEIAASPDPGASALPAAPRASWRPAPLPTPAAVAATTGATGAQTERLMSTNVQTSLESLRGIEGYIGACLVDSESGMCLGADGGGGVINLEIAAAANTEVVRAKRKAMKALNLRDDIEDILISLSKQYHVIRPMKARPTVFFYLVVDRARANLAMARLALTETERKLEI